MPTPLDGTPFASSSTSSDRPVSASGNGAPDISAALFAALFQALGHCPPSRRLAVLAALEARLGRVVDDLSAKLELLLAPGISEQDRIQGLWLLYLALASPSRGDLQMWIGPDLFSDDLASHLRLHVPEGEASAFRPGLQEELEILAQTVNIAVRVSLLRPGPGHLVAILLDATSPK